jgi:hypothetical protein
MSKRIRPEYRWSSKETAGRQAKTDGQPAHAQELKLACVFTQATRDKEGIPIRDPDSTTYTGAIESAELFGKRIYVEANQRGWRRAAKKVVLADGAEWIWNLADLHFPGAIQIVDLQGEELPSLEGSSNSPETRIPDYLTTFQVMKRTLGTGLQEQGTFKDAKGGLSATRASKRRAISTCRGSRAVCLAR